MLKYLKKSNQFVIVINLTLAINFKNVRSITQLFIVLSKSTNLWSLKTIILRSLKTIKDLKITHSLKPIFKTNQATTGCDKFYPSTNLQHLLESKNKDSIGAYYATLHFQVTVIYCFNHQVIWSTRIDD